MKSACEQSELVQALEGRLVNAWPSLEVQIVDGWLLRFASGYSKRANSATAILPGARLDRGLMEHVAGQFERRGIRPVFRLTGLEDFGCDEVLARQGWVRIEPSLCLAGIAQAGEIEPGIRLEAAASPAWVEQAAASYGGEKADAATLGEIVSRITNDAAFATLREDGRGLAWGMAVAERGFVGFYDIVVDPDLRGRGLGRRLVRSLMAWGVERGAHSAYLQVRADNAVARSLYEALGFEPAYSYFHRAKPPR